MLTGRKGACVVMKLDILKECAGAKTIGITGHVRPDGDCVGSCLALCRYLRNNLADASVKVFLEQPSDSFGELKGFDEIVVLEPMKKNCGVNADSKEEKKAESFDVFFVLDSMPDRTGAAECLYNAAVKKINIDHHVSNPGCGDVSLVEPTVGSACEVLYGLMDKEKLDADIALALYIGIIHDTGVFQYSNTRPETLRAAACLIGFGFDFPRLIQETFYQKTYLQTRIMGKVLEESRLLCEGKCVAGIVTKETLEEFGAVSGDLEGIVSQLRNIKGVHCAVFMYELGNVQEQEFKVSLRSDEYVNVAEIAAHFGGGGHVRAAGCTVKGMPEDVLAQVVTYIEAQLTSN
jgi:phosphoesterase RecJ-like protein